MWVFTKHGFVSAVRKKEFAEFLTVRARDRESLVELAEMYEAQIAKSPHADYPYRVFVKPADFAAWLAEAAVEIDYENFKNAVASSRGFEFAIPLNSVWAAMHDVEDSDARLGEAEHIDLS